MVIGGIALFLKGMGFMIIFSKIQSMKLLKSQGTCRATKLAQKQGDCLCLLLSAYVSLIFLNERDFAASWLFSNCRCNLIAP